MRDSHRRSEDARKSEATTPARPEIGRLKRMGRITTYVVGGRSKAALVVPKEGRPARGTATVRIIGELHSLQGRVGGASIRYALQA